MSSVNGCERQTALDASPPRMPARRIVALPRSRRLDATVVLRRLLERTAAIDVADVGRWLPSLLVRRLEKFELTAGIAG